MNRPIALLRIVHKRLLRGLFGLDDDAEPLVNRPWANRPWVSPQWGRHRPAHHAPRSSRVLKRWQNTIAGYFLPMGASPRNGP